MQTIFVFIKCELGQAYEVAADIVDNITQLSEIHSVSGEFDLLAKVHLDENQDIGRFVNETLHKIPAVKDTQTLMTFNAFT
jgi:DNA-binding Lrp family transcriptional regulator